MLTAGWAGSVMAKQALQSYRKFEIWLRVKPHTVWQAPPGASISCCYCSGTRLLMWVPCRVLVWPALLVSQAGKMWLGIMLLNELFSVGPVDFVWPYRVTQWGQPRQLRAAAAAALEPGC